MKPKKHSQLILPALRGVMGDWVYYSSLMSMTDLSARVSYANEVHRHKRLSEMIQRRLDYVRSKTIADYIKTQPQRFFSSLVVATYGGSPNWHALADVRINTELHALTSLTQSTVESVGFLTLRGDEKLFAIDGQHRLAGVKRVVRDHFEDEEDDEISVIFVAHRATDSGLERTRRLFTTLNKTARPVSKSDIIALDEDDAMAICARRLIEETNLFGGRRIAFVASNNMPPNNRTSLTTIGNLYDLLTILFTNSNFELKRRKMDLQRTRPSDSELEAYFTYCRSYFGLLSENFGELDEFFAATKTQGTVKKYRGVHGGSSLFRPLGLEIFTRIIARLTEGMSLKRAVRLASKLPRELDEAPYAGLMWDRSNGIIVDVHKVTLREILCYMIGRNAKAYPPSELLLRYRRALDDDEAKLPRRVTRVTR